MTKEENMGNSDPMASLGSPIIDSNVASRFEHPETTVQDEFMRDDSTFFNICSNLKVKPNNILPTPFNSQDLKPDFVLQNIQDDKDLHSTLLKFSSALTDPKLFANLSLKQEFCEIHKKMKKAYIAETIVESES